MSKIIAQIESLLFISNQPFTFKKLAQLVNADTAAVEQAVTELVTMYNNNQRGVNITVAGDKVQMVTSGDNTKLVADFIKEETTGELTKASLETLTIVAYRGPITRPELEQIRGVNCAVILRNLLMRGLVEAHEEKKKMQISYSVTLDFLKFLGITGQSELPDYEKLNSSESLKKILTENKQETV